jgi:hypothetical protein
MATLISKATGDFTAAGTWGVVNAASLLDSEAGNTALTTSYVSAAAGFTPGAGDYDGVAVKITSRAASPTGTLTICLSTSANGSGVVTNTEIAVNVSGLDVCSVAANEGGWVFIKFAATVTLGAGAYFLNAKTSSASMVNLYRDATTANWSRLLRSTTTGAPAAGDTLHVIGELTGTGTGNSWTVTMQNTTTDIFGAIWIGKRGILSYGVAASTAYYLKTGAVLAVKSGGTLNLGASSGAAIPSTSSAVLEFNCSADGDYGLVVFNGGTFNAYGNPITFVATLLASDIAANDTHFHSADSTGWVNGDVLAIASVSRTPAETEQVTISGTTGGTQVDISVGGGTGGNSIKYAHALTGNTASTPVTCEIINLTRNVKIRSASSTAHAYLNFKATSIATMRYAEMYYVGANTAGKRGVEIETTTGTCDIQYCSLHDTRNWGLYLVSASGSNITWLHNVAFNLNTAAGSAVNCVLITSSSGVTTFDYNYFLLLTVSAQYVPVILISSPGMTFTNNVVVGASPANCYVVAITAGIIGTFSGNNIHSCSGNGLSLTLGNGGRGTIAALTTWRNASGIYAYSNGFGYVTFTGLKAFGNSVAGISVVVPSVVILNAAILSGDSVFAQPIGLSISGIAYIIDSTLGTPVAHTTADIATGVNANFGRVYATNTTLATAGVSVPLNFVQVGKLGGVSTTHKTWQAFGTLTSETATRHTFSGLAWKLTSLYATYKLRFPGPTEYDAFKAAVVASAQVTVTAWLMKDAAYNGNAPRLVLVGGLIAGITTDQTNSLTEAVKSITAASNATPIVITAAGHGYSTGDVVTIANVGGNTAANGTWTITLDGVDPTNKISLNTSIGNGNWTSGGTASRWVQLSVSGTPSEAGVIDFYVDCDGTAGNVYVDDIAVAQAGLPGATGLDYVSRGLPADMIYAAAGGGAVDLPEPIRIGA